MTVAELQIFLYVEVVIVIIKNQTLGYHIPTIITQLLFRQSEIGHVCCIRYALLELMQSDSSVYKSFKKVLKLSFSVFRKCY